MSGRPNRFARWIALAMLALLAACSKPAADVSIAPYTATREMMNTFVDIQIYGAGQVEAARAATAAFAAIEALAEKADPRVAGSDTKRLNEAGANEPVVLDPAVFDTLKLAHEISIDSGGAFDVTFAGVGRLWDLKHPEQFRVPTEDELRAALKGVDYRKLVLDAAHHAAWRTDTATRVDLGGIAKGWAVDVAMATLRQFGVRNAIVNAGGNMALAGSRDGKPFRIGVQAPRGPHGEFFRVLQMVGPIAVSTSGDYERFVMHEGKRYHHIFDPHDGKPARRCRSVTVVGPNAALADALSTAVFVMGPQAGEAMVSKRYPACAAMVVDAHGGITETANFGALTTSEVGNIE